MPVTFEEALLESAQRSGAAFASTAESGSTTTALADSALADNAGGNPDAYAGGWIYRPDAAAAGDKLRALPGSGSFNTQAVALLPLRAWTNAPSAGEVYYLFALLPPKDQPGQPESWARLVNRALGNLYTVAELPIASGGTGATMFPIRPPVVTLLAAVAVAGGSGATVTTPTGWTKIGETNLSTTIKLALYHRRQLLTDPIEWEVNFDTTRVATGIVLAYVDANPSSPIDTSAATSDDAAASIACPTVTTAAAYERVLRIACSATPAIWAGPASPTLRLRRDAVLEDGAADYALVCYDQEITQAGAAGTATLTPSTSGDLIAYSVAFAVRDADRRTLFAASSQATTGSAGAATLTLTRPLNLPSDEWTPNREHVRKVVLRDYRDEWAALYAGQPRELDMSKKGRTWSVSEAGVLRLSVAPQSGQEVVVEVQRPFPALVADNDTTDCTLERLALRTRMELFRYLNSAPITRGKYQSELAQATADWRDEERNHPIPQIVVGP